MTRLRRRVAERLKAAQNAAAMLTTFNEIDMSQAIALRERWRAAFEKKHGVRLGFMSIFVKAAIVALREIPGVNAEIDGDDIVYKNHYDIGVAVGTEQGLVVPVLRDADRLELCRDRKDHRRPRPQGARRQIVDRGSVRRHLYDLQRRRLRLVVVDPDPEPAAIRHPRHAQDRAAAGCGFGVGLGGEAIEIRPMMYVALSYDHRIVDGREAVSFLVRVKELVEDPSRLLFDI